MNSDLVPEVLVDKNGKSVTRHLSARKVRKLGLKVAPLPPQVDPAISESKEIRAGLISLWKKSPAPPVSMQEWNFAIHKLNHATLKELVAVHDENPDRLDAIFEWTCQHSNDQACLMNLFTCLPVFDGKDYSSEFMSDIVHSMEDMKVFPANARMQTYKGDDRKYLEAVLTVSAAMHFKNYGDTAVYDPWMASIKDEDLRDLLRSHPESADEVAVIAAERGPALTGQVARDYLKLGPKVLSEGLL